MHAVVAALLAPFLVTTGCTAAPTDASAGTTGPPSQAVASRAVPTPAPVQPSTTVTSAASSGVLPAFAWSQRRVSAADLPHTWRVGCPVGPSALRAVTLRFYGFDGRAHDGVLVVAASASTGVVAVFRQLYAERFPIRRMVPVDAYGGSDDRSVAADNTAGFNCRKAVTTGPASWSMHAYGLAIDVNPVENPYIEGGRVIPPAGSAFVNRSRVRPGMATAGKTVVAAFAARGWRWGGRWSAPDYQHFSTNGR
jgi:hypothetical protein